MSEQVKRQHSDDSPSESHKSDEADHGLHGAPKSPGAHGSQFLLPSPIPTRRTRTLSL